MYVYTLDTPGDSGRRLTAEQAIARINYLTGRDIGSYILNRAIPYSARRTPGCATAYVAANRDSPFRTVSGGAKGFKVRRETPTREDRL